MTACGRICCDADGRLNTASVLLEGTRELNKGRVTKLNLSQVPNYSIFPGQVVAAHGASLNGGTTFAASKLLGASMPSFAVRDVDRSGLERSSR